MATGRVLKYDELRGYGFASQDDGGEDVFIHVNELEFNKELLAPNARIEFSIEEGERGLKGFGVTLLGPPPAVQHSPTPARAERDTRAGGENSFGPLTVKDFSTDVVEELLTILPTMTGGDILKVRDYVVTLARRHGWVKD
jgi:cold shock protein